jgi:hypothetical protein
VKSTLSQILPSFQTLYGLRRPITALTRQSTARHPGPGPSSSYTPYCLSEIQCHIMIPPMLGPSGGLFPPGLHTEILYIPPNRFLQHALPISPSSASSLYLAYTRRTVQLMELPVMQFSPPSRHSIPLRSKYSSQHPVLKHPQFMFFPQ